MAVTSARSPATALAMLAYTSVDVTMLNAEGAGVAPGAQPVMASVRASAAASTMRFTSVTCLSRGRDAEGITGRLTRDVNVTAY